jgi:hypothetical protein
MSDEGTSSGSESTTPEDVAEIQRQIQRTALEKLDQLHEERKKNKREWIQIARAREELERQRQLVQEEHDRVKEMFEQKRKEMLRYKSDDRGRMMDSRSEPVRKSDDRGRMVDSRKEPVRNVKKSKPVVEATPSKHLREGGKSSSSCLERRRHKQKDPPKFKGDGPWKDYKIQFEACKKYNNWSNDQASFQLFTSCEGDALSALSTSEAYPGETKYEEMLDVLEKEFGPRECPENYFLELTRREQKSNESLRELGRDIKRLSVLAYPLTHKDERDRISRDYFKKAIGDAEIRKELFRASPTSLQEAITKAEVVESFARAEQLRRPKTAYNRVLEAEQARQPDSASWPPQPRHADPPVCYKCRKPGHLKRNCPQAQERSITCFRCHQPGHMARECRQRVLCDGCGQDCHQQREIEGNEPRLNQRPQARPREKTAGQNTSSTSRC